MRGIGITGDATREKRIVDLREELRLDEFDPVRGYAVELLDVYRELRTVKAEADRRVAEYEHSNDLLRRRSEDAIRVLTTPAAAWRPERSTD